VEALLRTRRGPDVTDKRKLIEVALPLEAINDACKGDKDRKTGTIRNLHKWFAPMPTPAWRALIFAALVDDPGNPEERSELLELVKALVASETAPPPPEVLKRAQRILEQQPGGMPHVLDPFCGGGSTIVEAQRLGLDSVAGDLNPVAVLLTRMLTCILPKMAGKGPVGAHARLANSGGIDGFVSDVEFYAHQIHREAKDRIARCFPPVAGTHNPIAYRWALTVPSPDPRFQGYATPLVGDWCMSKKKGGEAYLVPHPNLSTGEVNYEVRYDAAIVTAPSKSVCLFSGAPISFNYVREQGRAGHLDEQLIAVVAQDGKSRSYWAPDERQRAAAADLPPHLEPDLDLPHGGLGFRIQEYGLAKWSQVFTRRQALVLSTYADLVAELPSQIVKDGGDPEYAEAVVTMLGICVGKLASFSSRQCLWRVRNGPSKIESAFGRAALPMPFDFAEANPFGGSVGDWLQVVETAIRALRFAGWEGPPATVVQRDARSAVPDAGRYLVATDPPYFSQIGYADLSDYFYVWLRPALKEVHPDLFGTLLTPKMAELIADPSRHGGDAAAASKAFVDGFTETFEALKVCSRGDLPLLIVYAYKQQETLEEGRAATGWDAMLEAIIRAGLSVVGTWPIHGTGSTRQRAQASNALATYVLLVCRPRHADAGLATRREFQLTLRLELGVALRDLQSASIAPVDLAQAAIGPGMAVFSRFARVVEADGSSMTVRAALGLINEALDETLSEQESEFDPDTRWALAWFEQVGMSAGAFGVAETLSKAKNTAINGLVLAGILESKAGKVRLLERTELPDSWNPTTDTRLTVWELTQQLIRALESGGDNEAASLLRRVGGLGETARELAYRLYVICERKKWAKEAMPYNSLVVSWPEISRLAAATSKSDSYAQQELL